MTTADMAEALTAGVGFEVDRRRIQLDQPIRDLGIYDVEIRLMAEVTATFKVAVVREGEGWVQAEARAAAAAAKAPAATTEEAPVEAEA